ncbi:MAG: FhaA domain-containing protein [Gaiellaceae bacterium]
MSVLRNIESKIESLFEGVFGRAFRTHVQPVELARKLVKEMDDHRNVSVSRIYVPNEYEIYLSTADREQFDEYEDSLVDELQDYLAEHARRESYVLLSPPKVVFKTDEDLTLGEFGIATRMAHKGGDGEPESQVEPGATMVYRPRQPQQTEAVSSEELGLAREVVTVEVEGRRIPIEKRRAVIGRSRECDVQVADPNVSRRHAELRQEGATYWLVDLDSTNGIEVDGRRQKRVKLENGTRVTIGATELVFHRELQ